MRAIVAVDGAAGRRLAEALRAEGVEVPVTVTADAPADAVADTMTGHGDVSAAVLLGELARADVVVLAVARHTLTAQVVTACDRFGVRIVAVCDGDADERLAAMFGLAASTADEAVTQVVAPRAAPAAAQPRGRVIAVWGAAGSPGRTTVAIELACELARDGRRVALVDADAHAPSIALMTGLADEGPGFAAACRQAERGTLTVAELARIAVPLGTVEVLTGLNRPGRWPELTGARVTAALERCRDWVDDVVVDVAASLERDEEIVSDLDGPRRNAATLGVLGAADLVVAVVAADPVGVSRFVRAHAELRAAVGATPVRVLVNKSRASALGMDARGQVRRAIERYAGIRDQWFVPWDPKATDAAMLAAQPIAHIAGRSALAGAMRRFVGAAIEPPAARTAPRTPRAATRRTSRQDSRAQKPVARTTAGGAATARAHP
ncbi:AAA family ATPase [Microbacterium sp.]|uniref:AAA family ATPase n=1 Tax=Microbacterium sp. TaxID=51671 RepID=UPI0039E257CC